MKKIRTSMFFVKYILAILLLLNGSTFLFGQTGTPAVQPVDGDGSAFFPYEIDNIAHLRWVSQNAGWWNFHMIQTANINASETRTWSANGFDPIGDATTNFTGEYDGQGFRIDNLFINRPNDDDISLFGYVNGGKISNLIILSAEITGNNSVGGISGFSINSVYNNIQVVDSRIEGKVYIAGLVGNHTYVAATPRPASIILNSLSSGSVISGDDYVGGLVGELVDDTITNSYASNVLRISGPLHIGGCVGNSTGTINKVYSSSYIERTDGATDVPSTFGGVVGFNGGPYFFPISIMIFPVVLL